jgi:hypothetical protein
MREWGAQRRLLMIMLHCWWMRKHAQRPLRAVFKSPTMHMAIMPAPHRTHVVRMHLMLLVVLRSSQGGRVRVGKAHQIASSLLLLLGTLLVVIEGEIVQDRRDMSEVLEYAQHLKARLKRNLLCVPAVGHRLVLVLRNGNVAEVPVAHILDNMPLNIKQTLPLILLPVVNTSVKVNWADHFSHSTELTTSIHREEKKDRALGLGCNHVLASSCSRDSASSRCCCCCTLLL